MPTVPGLLLPITSPFPGTLAGYPGPILSHFVRTQELNRWPSNFADICGSVFLAVNARLLDRFVQIHPGKLSEIKIYTIDKMGSCDICLT